MVLSACILPPGSNWQIMCVTTPADIDGHYYASPAQCLNLVRRLSHSSNSRVNPTYFFQGSSGIHGAWDNPDVSCGWCPNASVMRTNVYTSISFYTYCLYSSTLRSPFTVVILTLSFTKLCVCTCAIWVTSPPVWVFGQLFFHLYNNPRGLLWVS